MFDATSALRCHIEEGRWTEAILLASLLLDEGALAYVHEHWKERFSHIPKIRRIGEDGRTEVALINWGNAQWNHDDLSFTPLSQAAKNSDHETFCSYIFSPSLYEAIMEDREESKFNKSYKNLFLTMREEDIDADDGSVPYIDWKPEGEVCGYLFDGGICRIDDDIFSVVNRQLFDDAEQKMLFFFA